MTNKDFNIDELTDEELEEYLNSSEDDDYQADETSSDEDIESSDAKIYKDEEEKIIVSNETKVSEEIDMLPPRERKRLSREEKKKKEQKDRARRKEIKIRRKALLREPSKLVRYDTDPEMGLPEEIVEDRRIDGLTNGPSNTKSKPIWKIIVSNIITFFNILIFAIAGFLIAVGAYTDLVFLLIVVTNITIGIIIEIRSKKKIDSISLMSSPTAIVKRTGVNHEVPISEVVLDDLILLDSGKQICADSILIDGTVEVNESLLTGESEAIQKKPGDQLYAGSFVTSGKCSARVDKVGKDNYIEKLSNQAKVYKKPKSDLLQSLNWIIRIMTFPVVGFGIALFCIMYFNTGLDFTTSIRKTAGAMIGMIPSGLFLTSSIALTLSIVRLSDKNVLVQELYCIEMLARVNCICLDKTGTITDGTLVVKNVIDYNTIYGLATKNIVSAMLNALDDSNMTSEALKEKFGLGKRIKHVAAIPFSSQRKYQAVTFDKFGTFILGAPEFVLKNNYERYQNDVTKYAQLGYRVLCLAHKEGVIENGQLPNSETVTVSMILIEDTIRPDAINTIRYFKESGVEVKVISGDNEITVSKISQRAGIENADKYISLYGMSDDDVKNSATKYTVFGRVSPSQKRLLIQALKEAGQTVAMTGDGVNDILALREADCSIAVASGSEAARNCSHLVLLDSNFDSMPNVVAEGRRVINNITKVSALFLTKTIFSLFLAIQATIMGTYPISTNQLFLIDLLAIGFPSVVLINESNNVPVKGRFLFNVIKEALPGALTILLISVIVFSLKDVMYLDDMTLTTIIVIAASHTCLMVLFKVCRPFNVVHKVVCLVSYVVFLFAIFFMPQFLEFRPLITTSEYYSSTLKEDSMSYYPRIEYSRPNFYVFDDKVTALRVDSNISTTSLSAVMGTVGAEAGKLYYAVNGTRPYYVVNEDKVYFELNIPTLSFTKSGEAILGGYLLNDLDSLESGDIVVDSQGYLSVVKTVTDADGKESKVNVELYVTLDRTDAYYKYSLKYGQYLAKDAVRRACIMPTIEIKNGEFVIDGVQSNEYKYKVKSVENTYSILSEGGEYFLLVNGQKIYATNNDGTTRAEAYKIEAPTLSSTVVNNGKSKIYLNGIHTGYSIFDLYGTKDPMSSSYSITRTSDNAVITYNKENGKFYVNGTEDAAFKFDSVSYNGFADYKDKNGETINVLSGETLLQVSANNNDTAYSLVKGAAAHEIHRCSKATIDNSIYAPKVEVTVENNYIIDGYYTHYAVSNSRLNPQKNVDNYLILGGTVTDYHISTNNLITKTDGLVNELSVENKIFLLMLCLLAAPVMRLLQFSVPWFKKQIELIKKIIGRM